MKPSLNIFRLTLTIAITVLTALNAKSQVSSTGDSTKKIEIINANSLRQIAIDDTTLLETLSGNAICRQGGTTLSGDSIVLNKRIGTVEVFGNVHINDADTVNTYSGYLLYNSKTQVANLKNNIRFIDGNMQLTTNDLEYDVQSGIAKYKNGGKVVNNSTTLTSKDAVYYSNTKDAFFYQNVKLSDPKYTMKSDSLRYNTYYRSAYFISPTEIKSKTSQVTTRSGTYNLETGKAYFDNKTEIKDQSVYLSGNKIAIDEKSNSIQAEENAFLIDTANRIKITGDQIILNRNKNSMLATRKPVMILYKDGDSTFITADTLFSGTTAKAVTNKKDSIHSTSVETKKIPDSIRYFIGHHHVRIYNDSIQAIADSLHYTDEDSSFKLFSNPICWNGNTQMTGDTMILFTTQQKPSELRVFNNAIVINKTTQGFFNQMGGKTMYGYFKDGNIDFIRTKGNPGESIFYPQDEDSAYIGMNRSKADAIDVFFADKNINKIKYTNSVSGTLYPMNQIPNKLDRLNNFNWQPEKRPLSRLAIFE